MENRRNYYRVLHVQPDAPVEIIRTSYHTLMQRLRMHPDLGGDHWNAVLINEAFRTLNDPVRRAAYDRTRRDATANARDGSLRGARGTQQPQNRRLAGVAAGFCPFCGTMHATREATIAGSSCASCGSPLYPAVKLQLENASRRALERLPRQIEMSYCLTWPTNRSFDGLTDDLSIAGMRFTSSLELAPQERLRIDCGFCSAVAVVRNSRRASRDGMPAWQSGVEFLTLRIKHPKGGLVSRDF
jgi:DnaJ domain